MRLIILADSYFPKNNSASILIHSLVKKLIAMGHSVVLVVPDFGPEIIGGIPHKALDVVRVKIPAIKSSNKLVRLISEVIMPFLMIFHLFRKNFLLNKFDGIIWYSPSIFLTPAVHTLKKISGCNCYLILRDIFPQWAIDLGIIKSYYVARFFEIAANYQYKIADTIGVQSPGNLIIFREKLGVDTEKIDVLENWLETKLINHHVILQFKSKPCNRVYFIYTGNMGVAQNIQIIFNLAKSLANHEEVGFIFVGWGDALNLFREYVNSSACNNIEIFSELPSKDLEDIFLRSHIGIVALDSRHTTHNIPGKFLSYLSYGLPILASTSESGDLAEIIKKNKLGIIFDELTQDSFKDIALQMARDYMRGNYSAKDIVDFAVATYSDDNAATKILNSLKKSKK
jgi:glycosyltransferase involved in cell wall biosynthesis